LPTESIPAVTPAAADVPQSLTAASQSGLAVGTHTTADDWSNTLVPLTPEPEPAPLPVASTAGDEPVEPAPLVLSAANDGRSTEPNPFLMPSMVSAAPLASPEGQPLLGAVRADAMVAMSRVQAEAASLPVPTPSEFEQLQAAVETIAQAGGEVPAPTSAAAEGPVLPDLSDSTSEAAPQGIAASGPEDTPVDSKASSGEYFVPMPPEDTSIILVPQPIDVPETAAARESESLPVGPNRGSRPWQRTESVSRPRMDDAIFWPDDRSAEPLRIAALDDDAPAAEESPAPSKEETDHSVQSLVGTTPAGTDEASAGTGEASDPEKATLGEEPAESDAPLRFLRRQTILLEPGEFQFDVALQYSNDTNDLPFVFIDGSGGVQILEARQRQRLLSVPLEMRVGLWDYTQAFVTVPFGWSNSEFSLAGQERADDIGGIGDVSAGITRQIVIGNEYFPDILSTASFSAPSGQSSLGSALSTPGSSLGQGFWTVGGDLTFIQTYDPLVFFYGVGYQVRFKTTFGDVTVDPGNLFSYRLGVGFAVNPHVTLSAAFTGALIGRNEVNDTEVGGSIQEPMQVRLAATVSRRKQSKTHQSFKLVEPFVNFGLNDDSVDTLVGISWTH
jgi:hypothetical protein